MLAGKNGTWKMAILLNLTFNKTKTKKKKRKETTLKILPIYGTIVTKLSIYFCVNQTITLKGKRAVPRSRVPRRNSRREYLGRLIASPTALNHPAHPVIKIRSVNSKCLIEGEIRRVRVIPS